MYNARAYLEINPKYVYSIGLAANKLLLEDLYHRKEIESQLKSKHILNTIFDVGDLIYETIVSLDEKERGHLINRSFPRAKNASKRWILDVDYNDSLNQETLPEIIKTINKVGLDYNEKELNVFVNPTISGCHVIFDPTNLNVLSVLLTEKYGLTGSDIKKDNATLLYFE